MVTLDLLDAVPSDVYAYSNVATKETLVRLFGSTKFVCADASVFLGLIR